MTKENIIIASLRLFLMRGYKSVSLVDVASELGITKGGIYHYFASKDELLHAALHFFLDRFEAKYQAMLSSSGSLKGVLQALLVDDALDFHAKELLGVDNSSGIDHIHFAIEIMRLFPDVQDRIQKNQAEFCTAIAVKMQRAIELGEIRQDVDNEALAAIFVAMLNGQKSLGLDRQGLAMRRRMLDNFWKLLSKVSA